MEEFNLNHDDPDDVGSRKMSTFVPLSLVEQPLSEN